MKFSCRLFLIIAACSLNFSVVHTTQSKNAKAGVLPGFQEIPFFNEQILTFTNNLGVRIHINAPSLEQFASGRSVTLIFYGLPNGNTIEQTIGRKLKPGDDWHFDIQHIGAQTRFLREMLKHETIVVVYLENTLKAWPAWRKKNGDESIPRILDSIKKHFKGRRTKIVLTGHSGGGSLTFGYLNCVKKIPQEVERIAFLDSNYAYDTAQHKDKLVRWLKASSRHSLIVLAYHDSIALLNGKTFVSAAGGTWGKSHLMKKDLEQEFKLDDHLLPEWQNYSGLKGRLKFFLKENPEKKILHTVQVERNGFIHAIVAGTTNENNGYEYFGERAYANFIQAE